MKKSFLLSVLCILMCTAFIHAQSISLSVKNVALSKVLKEIERQSDYRFIYTRELMDKSQPVTAEFADQSIEFALEICFRNQPLSYTIEDKHIAIRSKEMRTNETPSRTISSRGRVINREGQPLRGISIQVKGSSSGVVSDDRGEFVIPGIMPGTTLSFTGAETETVDMKVNSSEFLTVSLSQKINELDETVIKGYYNTSRRLNTGSVATVSGEDIERQPVSNVLAALEGRVPGLNITQSNGVPGSTIKVEIRGRNSIAQGSEPLFIIDGVPFASGNEDINQLSSAQTTNLRNGNGLSPFFLINPADIERIEILKDAEATAIYGSRGANGVVLITTRRPKTGKPRVTLNYSSGWSRVTRSMDFLNTEQYLAVRNEAFANDGLTPSATQGTLGFAPDLKVWDTTRYTDFKKLFIGGTAHVNQAQVSLSGGTSQLQFLLGGAYYRETTVFPGDMYSGRGSVNFSLNYAPSDSKFDMSFTSNYSSAHSNLSSINLAQFVSLPPNFPSFFDSDGKLRWDYGGLSYSDLSIDNPMSQLLRVNDTKSDNLMGNLRLGYSILNGLKLTINLGYNRMSVDESQITPSKSIDPQKATLGYAYFGNNDRKSWNLEPQLSYDRKLGNGRISVLSGMTLLSNDYQSDLILGRNYTNDAVINSIAGAATITASNFESKYRYASLFGRINYVLKNRYIVNFSARRDASSRFGSKERFANFAASSVGWIFTNEPLLEPLIPILSFGKIRASYGTTGNDQIGDYKYLNSWMPAFNTYQGSSGLVPTALYNPNYAWEVNKKFESAIELGFFKDRILLTAAYYRNRIGNQLINLQLPTQAGFSSVLQNVDALVENKGLELSLETTLIKDKKFSWRSALNISFPKNKLVRFPGLNGLAASSYSFLYKEGQSLSLIRGYHYLGVDPQTGVYQFQDQNRDGNLTYPDDYVINGNRDPKFYGGLSNDFRLGSFDLQFHFEFRKQTGINFLGNISRDYPFSVPAFMYYSYPIAVLDRWASPGDISKIQKLTGQFGTPAFVAANNLNSSDGIYGDASFIRLKSLSVSYRLSFTRIKQWLSEPPIFYCRAQNILTFTTYRGADPENQNLYSLQPLRTITCGLQLTF